MLKVRIQPDGDGESLDNDIPGCKYLLPDKVKHKKIFADDDI
jgi:hypothetical protein